MHCLRKATFVGLFALLGALVVASEAKATCGPPDCRLTALGAGCAPAVATEAGVSLDASQAIRVSTLCRLSCSAPGGPASTITADPTGNATVTREGVVLETKTTWSSERCGAELVGVIEPAAGSWESGRHDVALGTSLPTTFQVPESSSTGCTTSRRPLDVSTPGLASGLAIALGLVLRLRLRRSASATKDA